MEDDFFKFLEEFKAHLRHPINYGKLWNANGYAEERNSLCGDIVAFYLHISKDRIENASYEVQGCVLTKLGATIVSDAIRGKTLVKIIEMKSDFAALLKGNSPSGQSLDNLSTVFAKRLQVYPSRHSCV